MNNQKTRPICMITGGSSGIGLATAKLFYSHGFHVSICGRDAAKLKTAATEIKHAAQHDADSATVLFEQIDLANPHQATAFAAGTVEAFGTIDVLVNNAAFVPLENFENVSPKVFESLIDVNLRSHFYLTQHIWKNMTKKGGGTIVNISSLSAIDPFPGLSLYGASKAWMDLMTQSLAAEGKNKNIRVCSIRPGAVETPLLRGLFPDFPADQCVPPERIANMVLGCVNDPETYPSGGFFPVTDQT